MKKRMRMLSLLLVCALLLAIWPTGVLAADRPWESAYRSVLKSVDYTEYYGGLSAHLLDLNADGTPELLFGCMPGSALVTNIVGLYTYYNGSAIEIPIEFQNLNNGVFCMGVNMEDVAIPAYALYQNTTTGDLKLEGGYLIRGGMYYRDIYLIEISFDGTNYTEETAFRLYEVNGEKSSTKTYYVGNSTVSRSNFFSQLNARNDGWVQIDDFCIASDGYYDSAPTDSQITNLFSQYVDYAIPEREPDEDEQDATKKLFVLGTHNNQFSHDALGEATLDYTTGNDIGIYYRTSLEYYSALIRGLSYSEQMEILDYMNTGIQSHYDGDEADEDWGGSCHGLVLSMVLAHQGVFDLSKVNAKNYYDVKTINNHLELRDAINFYQLTELRDEGKPTGHVLNDGLRGKIKGALTSNLYATDQGFWNAFVDEARQSINAGKPIVFGMAYTSGGSKVGHSLVVCGFSEIDDYYVFETYDCNNIGDDKTGVYLYIVVHKNSYNFYLQYGRNPEEVLPQDGTASFITFYATNVPDNRNWFELSFWSADDIYNQIAKLGENIGLQKQIETDNVAKLSNNSQRSVITFDANSPVKIINSEGKSLSYNGVSLTGDMNVYDIQLVGNRELKLKVITDESGQFKVENPIDDKMYSIEMDGAYFSAGAIGADEIIFEGKNGIGIEGNQFRFDVSLSDGTTKTLSHVSGISSNDCSISCNEEYIELENDGEYSNVQIKNYGNDESEKRIDDSFKGKQIQKNPFVDVSSNSYYYDAVLWAVDNGITTGTSDTTFSPNASCTRAQAVTFLWRAAGEPEPEGTGTKFSDVPSGQYYSKAVQWAVEQGITSGTGNGEFSPNATCSRAQIVTFLWRLEGKPTVSGGNNFADVSDGAYYVDAVTWAVQNGITTGTSSTMFTPAADCSRAQIVTFLYRDLA